MLLVTTQQVNKESQPPTRTPQIAKGKAEEKNAFVCAPRDFNEDAVAKGHCIVRELGCTYTHIAALLVLASQ